MAKPRLKWTVTVCVECGRVFEYGRHTADKKFCSLMCMKRCHNVITKKKFDALYRFENGKEKLRQAKHSWNAKPYTIGMYALERDPWTSGCLPVSVTANALWG